MNIADVNTCQTFIETLHLLYGFILTISNLQQVFHTTTYTITASTILTLLMTFLSDHACVAWRIKQTHTHVSGPTFHKIN